VDGDDLLAEQLAYYRGRAATYRDELYEVGSPPSYFGTLVDQLGAVVDRLGVGGDALELACGPGVWTELLVPRCRSVLALDGAPEMLAAARQRVPSASYELANLLDPAWAPPSRFDTVFFGFWLSHVPMDRFEQFWAAVRSGVAPGGRVAFVDSAPADAAHDVVDGDGTARRTLPDGTTARIVKVFHDPDELAARLDRLGWDAEVRPWGEWFLSGVARPR
jgi:demethylmenaquinone methyltransferase/2-methoxy-6-polyprenyl-1,4-benzoquinol methylase